MVVLASAIFSCEIQGISLLWIIFKSSVQAKYNYKLGLPDFFIPRKKNCGEKITSILNCLNCSLSNYSSGGFSNKSSLNDSGVVGDQEMDSVSEDKLRLQVNIFF